VGGRTYECGVAGGLEQAGLTCVWVVAGSTERATSSHSRDGQLRTEQPVTDRPRARDGLLVSRNGVRGGCGNRPGLRV